jgi:hypothetical protein
MGPRTLSERSWMLTQLGTHLINARANRFEHNVLRRVEERGVVSTNSGTDVSNNCSTGHMCEKILTEK